MLPLKPRLTEKKMENKNLPFTLLSLSSSSSGGFLQTMRSESINVSICQRLLWLLLLLRVWLLKRIIKSNGMMGFFAAASAAARFNC
jgi:hypothetical protein